MSEVGFGLWTVSTGWWGNYTDEEAIALMHQAFDLGVTLFDAADTYGNGRSEELVAKAFREKRDQIVIATKVGYDFVNHGEERRGQREIPQNFRPEAIRLATDAALKRLATDRIDLLQLHNIRMEQVDEDGLWETLEDLRTEGKVRQYGIALGPAIGWLAEGVRTIRRRNPAVVQHIYNLLEQHPGKAIHNSARELRCEDDVPHSRAAFVGDAGGQIYGGHSFSTERSPQSSSSLLAPQWCEEGRAIAVSRTWRRADTWPGGDPLAARG